MILVLVLLQGNPGPPGPNGSKGKAGPRGMKVNIREYILPGLQLGFSYINLSLCDHSSMCF